MTGVRLRLMDEPNNNGGVVAIILWDNHPPFIRLLRS